MTHEGDCFLVPGPVRMSDACLQAMATPVMTARGPEFRDVMADLNAGLRSAFNLTPSERTRGTQSWAGEDGYKVVAVSGSGTAAMEMVIANRFRPNDRVLVAQICKQYCQVKHIAYDWGRSFDFVELEEQLGRGTYEAVLICHNETSTGITQDAASLAQMCKEYNVAFILDGITSVGGAPVHPAEWEAEAVVMGAQKCTAGPSGIAAIAINEHFIERLETIRKQGDSNPVYYLDLISALKKGDDDQTPWTPAINLAMGWAAALRELEEEGLENRWKRCQTLANGVRNLFTDLGFLLLADGGQQSDTVTAIMYPEGIDDSWRSMLKEKYDTQVIGAQDHLKGKMFRVGSMGTTTVEEMVEGCKRMIACFNEMGLSLPNVDVAPYFA